MVGEAGKGLACGVGCELGGGERRAPVGAFRGLVAKPPWLWVLARCLVVVSGMCVVASVGARGKRTSVRAVAGCTSKR